jgi:transposase
MGYSTEEIREKGIQAYQNGESVTGISKVLNVSRNTIYQWIKRYEQEGTVARANNPGSGRPSNLDVKEIQLIVDMIKNPADQFGFDTVLWTIRRIIIAANKYLKVKLSKSTLHRILCDKGLSYKKPESRYYEADKEAQRKWIKKTIPAIKRCVKEHQAILYFEDEANISLACATGKTWGPIGQKTIIKTTANRGSISAISAITKAGDLIFSLHEKKITKFEIVDFLRQMLAHHPKKHLVVVMDQAPVHKARHTQEFIESQGRLHIFYLPPRSPEFNPDEKIWNHLKNQELCAHKARNTKELRKITKAKLKKMANQPSVLRGIFCRSEIAELL